MTPSGVAYPRRRGLAQVAQGNTLSRALAGEPVFDAAVVRIVEMGEQTGQVKGALANAADYLERVGRLRRSMHNAVTKPLNVLTLVLLAIFIAAVALSFLVREVLPDAMILHHASLSATDRLALKISKAVRVAWPYVGMLGFVNFLLLKLLPRQPRARAIIEQVALGLPLVASATRATARACFFRTVAILMRSGALLNDGVTMAGQSATYAFMRNAVAQSVRKIGAGKPYLEVLVEDGFLHRRDVNAVQSAERRGDLGVFMLALADDCEREAVERVRTLTTVAHTTVVLLLGVTIAAVVLGLYVPVFILR